MKRKATTYTKTLMKRARAMRMASRAPTPVLYRPISSERKQLYFGVAPINITQGQTYLHNPPYWVTQGVTQGTRIGDKISDVKLNYRIGVTAVGLNASAARETDAIQFRVFIFSHTKEWQNAAAGDLSLNTFPGGNVIGDSEMYRDIGADRRVQTYLNYNDINVIHDKRHRVPINTDSTPIHDGEYRVFSGKVSLGDLMFNSSLPTSFLKRKNWYVAVTAANGGGTNGVVCRVRANFYLSWRDM